MRTILEQLPNRARVAVVRLRSLGDCVLTTPALDVLHAARPDLEIAVVVEPRFAAVFENNPAVGRILQPSLPRLLAFSPVLTLNLHGGTRSAILTAASLARWRAGFVHFSLPAAYNVRIPRAQEILGEERTVHTAEHLASAMFFLGAPRGPVPRARLFAEPRPLSGAYAVIHAMAAAPAKTWPAERFLAAARHIQTRWSLNPVFVGGPGEDLAAFREFPVMAGQSLEETKSLLSGASLFLGNDSGPAHMAAAFGLPTVVLFGPSDDVVWAPWRTAAEVLARKEGIDGIETAAVLAAIDRLKEKA
ncbi:MAG: glycosyltransferase family 9 protein [Acidobacteria bacterium]|nr:glycosyltransferase family 9 protein [Acidobacteriota bacterium]